MLGNAPVEEKRNRGCLKTKIFSVNTGSWSVRDEAYSPVEKLVPDLKLHYLIYTAVLNL
jgi:hypothetical protein